MDTIQPKALKVNWVLTERRSKLDEPHVAPLNRWVRSLRSRLGPSSIVPWFDPADGGIDARILWLLEAPGPRSTEQRGSGIISCDNNDGAAENTWRTRTEAGVDRRDVVHWNVIPYYIGNETKIRAWRPGDVANAGPLLAELMALLPRVRAVILGGKAAQKGMEGSPPGGRRHQRVRLSASIGDERQHPPRGLASCGRGMAQCGSLGHKVAGGL